MPDLAVVIVTWNVRALVLDALRSLYADLATSGLDAVVYVVDSASSDGTAEAVQAAFSQTRVIASRENLGFVRANNLALRELGFGTAADEALPKAVYLLNPDTLTEPGATSALYAAVTAVGGPGLAGARLSYEDGSFQHAAFTFPGLKQLWIEFFPTPGRFIEGGFNGRYPRTLYDSGQPFSVDFVLGATMMLRREVIQQTGMFDEGFFMYCEEIDWAWRIREAGWDVQCIPAARVVHLAGQSTGQARPETTLYLWTSRLRLFAKHWPAWKLWLGRRMVAAGMRRRVRSETRPELQAVYQQIIEMASAR
jgi:GT2 family glycosyltransferase